MFVTDTPHLWSLLVKSMKSAERIDYKAVGLKVGLEIHQQLKTNRKLFCRCKPQLIKKEPDLVVVRFMRPTLGETGDIDPTMLKEFKKRRKVVYQAYLRETCLYELDETPPYEIDKESLAIAIMIAKLLRMQIPDVVIVSRKQYLDGSVPSGFQRTLVVGLNGYLELSNGKKLGITHICLEEDAARKIDEKENEIIFRVDRLGIPLVEIGTEPDLTSPEEVLDAALRIGSLLRATKKVMRGIGTIRQDINVSIEGGARVEIKGVQKPEWFKILIDNEIRRQLELIKISKILKKRGIRPEHIQEQQPISVTEIFKKTKARFITKAIAKGAIVLAIKLPGFAGLLGKEVLPGKRFGKEFADRVKVITGLAGIIHTDELPAYGISEEEKRLLLEKTGADKELDAVAFVVGPEERAYDAIAEIKERAILAINGVPSETRRANPDGTTSFERPIGTAARLYPDTDSPPIRITNDILELAEKIKPEYPWLREKRYVEELGLSPEYAKRIILSERSELFEELVSLGISPKLAAITLLDTMISLRRDGFNVDAIPDRLIYDMFVKLKSNEISKEAIPDILAYLSKHPESNLEAALKELGLTRMTEEQLEEIIDNILRENIELVKRKREYSFKPLMGEVMKIVRGKIDGKTVSRVLKSKLEKLLSNL